MPENPVVIVYRDHLLPPSNTFVRSQAEALERFTPYFVGSRSVGGLSLPGERTLTVNGGGLPGKLRETGHRFLGVAPGLVNDLRRLNPALIHAHFGPDGALALPLARALQVPLLVTMHAYEVTISDTFALRSVNFLVYLRRKAALMREAGLFIAVSSYIKSKLLEQGFPPDRVTVHHIGVDTNAFHPDPAVPRERTVLFVGRLVEKKGCEYLIRAIAQVQAAMPDMEMVIIGDGPLRAGLEALAAQLLTGYRFLGTQPSQAVRDWMNRAMLLAAPSVTASSGDIEGLPIVILEAQAMGLPVVSTFHSGIPEAVIHEQTGFLAQEKDVEALARNVLRLLEDESLWQQFSREGRQQVATRFDLGTQTRALEDIYDSLLRGAE